MKKILLPTDFSNCSLLAVDFAANMARRVNGEIYLLHVIEAGFDVDTGVSSGGAWAGSTDTLTVPYMIEHLRLIKRRMHSLIKDSKLYGMDVIDEIETGDAHKKIASAADKYDADIIIMGTHGATGLKEVFLGSTAEKVVHHAHLPVLSIKESPNINPSTIVFASDFGDGTERIFSRVKKFAAIFNANIHLVTVADSDKPDHERRIRNFLNYSKADYPFTIYDEGNTERGILHFAKDIKADLIAIGSHGRAGLSRLFNPSISERLVNHSFLPLMTVNY